MVNQMKDETIIKLARLICGVVLLGIHAFTSVDGILISTALVLVGVPFELAKGEKEETKET